MSYDSYADEAIDNIRYLVSEIETLHDKLNEAEDVYNELQEEKITLSDRLDELTQEYEDLKEMYLSQQLILNTLIKQSI